MSKRVNISINSRTKLKDCKQELLNSLSNIEQTVINNYIKSTTSLSDKVRFIFFCIFGILPDKFLENINKKEIFFIKSSFKKKEINWLEKVFDSEPQKSSIFYLYEDESKVREDIKENFIPLTINNLISKRIEEATIEIKEVYNFTYLLGGKEVLIGNEKYFHISTGNYGNNFYYRFNKEIETWELYFNDEIKKSNTTKHKIKKFYGFNSSAEKNPHKALLLFFMYIIPYSINRENLGRIRNTLDIIRIERVNMGISDPVLEQNINNKVCCIGLNVNNLLINIYKTRELIPHIAYEFEKLGYPVFINKSGKYIVVNPPAEVALCPKLKILEEYLKTKYSDLYELLKENYNGIINRETIGECISDHPEYRKYLDEIYYELLEEVKNEKYELYDVFSLVSGMKTDKASKYAARMGLVTVPTAEVLEKPKNLIS
ncbi:hypothetical protein V6O07_23845 [Arthrospira platensis SPKY2]